jgi:hypothetical protein
MPVTGDFYNPYGVVPEILMPRSLRDYRGNLWFDASYIPEVDAYGNKIVEPGLIVAKALVETDATYGDLYKFVPYNAAAAYGPGSDTAYGILAERLYGNVDPGAIAVLYHAQVREAQCYILGGTKGVITNAVKTALPDIDWA